MLLDRLGVGLDQTPWSVLWRLVREHARAYAPRYAVAFVLMAIVAGCTAFSAYMVKDIINLIFVEQSRTALMWVPPAIAAIFIVKGLAAYFQEVTLARIGNRMVAETQRRLFHHILKMDIGFFERFPSSDLITRISHNAAAARQMLDLVALGLGRDLLTVAGLVVVMFWQDAAMAGFCLIAGPLAAIGLKRLVARVKKVAENEVRSLSTIIATMREACQGIRIVKSFQMEEPLRRRMGSGIADAERFGNKLVGIRALVNPLIDTLGGLAVAGVVLYAGWRSLGNSGTPGEFFSFMTALLMMADPGRRLSRLQIQLATAAIGVRMMYEVLDLPAAEEEDDGKPDLAIRGGEVRFEGVEFEYQAGVPVLRAVEFVAAAGRMTALVGLSGSGKTTVFSLIQGLRRPTKGRILIDGQPIDQVSLVSLRRSIALVSQDVFLFEGTVRENIRAGRPSATDGEVEAAARAARADAFIKLLPDGYATLVGELGANLSGGERQRISIARAVLKNAPIILLDEPTSALDSETERLIQIALRELTQARTAIVIAHRLSTVASADAIHVLSGGEVVQSGTHHDLLGRPGLYSRLHRLQFADAGPADDKADPQRTMRAGGAS